MWQENLLWGQKGKELPYHSPYLVHNHRAFRERSAGRTFYICYHFILFKKTACVLTVMSNEAFSQGTWDCVFRSFALTGFFFWFVFFFLPFFLTGYCCVILILSSLLMNRTKWLKKRGACVNKLWPFCTRISLENGEWKKRARWYVSQRNIYLSIFSEWKSVISYYAIFIAFLCS